MAITGHFPGGDAGICQEDLQADVADNRHQCRGEDGIPAVTGNSRSGTRVLIRKNYDDVALLRVNDEFRNPDTPSEFTTWTLYTSGVTERLEKAHVTVVDAVDGLEH